MWIYKVEITPNYVEKFDGRWLVLKLNQARYEITELYFPKGSLTNIAAYKGCILSSECLGSVFENHLFRAELIGTKLIYEIEIIRNKMSEELKEHLDKKSQLEILQFYVDSISTLDEMIEIEKRDQNL